MKKILFAAYYHPTSRKTGTILNNILVTYRCMLTKLFPKARITYVKRYHTYKEKKTN